MLVLGEAFGPNLRETMFNLVSHTTGTGYTSTDVTTWGGFSFAILFIFGLIGGCTASTGCSVKVFRYLVLKEALWAEFRRLLRPSIVTAPRLDGRAI